MTYQRSNTWWIKYYRNGKPYRESTRSSQETDAKRLLRKREGEIAEGKIPGVYFDRVRFDELAGDFLTDYKMNGRKTLGKAERSVKHLSEAFGGMRVPQITTPRVKAYITERMGQGYSNASINRELAALKRMLRMGAQQTPAKVNRVPYIPLLKENNTREGFFEYDQFIALRDPLPDYLRPVITFAYHTGWRKGEILGLTWDQVDLKEGIIRLNAGETKNGEARSLYLEEELFTEIRNLHSQRRLGCPHVFHHKGNRINNLWRAWGTACKAAGLWGFDEEKGRSTHTRVLHDLRRTGVRDMVRAGIPERVAMAISEHKTRSVFERYNIVSPEDLKEAAKKKQAYHEHQSSGTISGTMGKKMVSPLGKPALQPIDLFGAGDRG